MSEDKRADLVNFMAEKVQGELSKILKNKCYFEIDEAVEMTMDGLERYVSLVDNEATTI